MWEVLEEITIGMRMGNAPKVIHQNIEHTQNGHKNDCRVLGLEANDNHYTSQKSCEGEDDTGPRPLATT